MSTSQTLSRGLTALELVALADTAPSIEQIAAHLAVHRSIAYRIVRTLEEHNLVERDAAGGCLPGVRLAALARSARPTLQTAAVIELARLADEIAMTCFLVVRDGDEALTIESLEPTNSQFHLTYKPGIRHAIDRGAPGVAILAGDPPLPGERTEVAEARSSGFAMTSGEVIPGLASVAVPVHGHAASIAAVFLSGAGHVPADIADHLTTTASAIQQQIAASSVPAAS